jgi:hypothetical protein
VRCGVLHATVVRLDLLENVMFICVPFTGPTIGKAMTTKTLDTPNARKGLRIPAFVKESRAKIKDKFDATPSR